MLTLKNKKIRLIKKTNSMSYVNLLILFKKTNVIPKFIMILFIIFSLFIFHIKKGNIDGIKKGNIDGIKKGNLDGIKDTKIIYKTNAKINSNILNKNKKIQIKTVNNNFMASYQNTLFIIIDPWPTGIIEKKILHKIREFIQNNNDLNFLIITEKLEKNRRQDNTLTKKYVNLINNNSNIFFTYHENFDESNLRVLFENNKIKNLIYMGFHLDACIMNRKIGTLDMKNEGFNVFVKKDFTTTIDYDEKKKYLQILKKLDIKILEKLKFL